MGTKCRDQSGDQNLGQMIGIQEYMYNGVDMRVQVSGYRVRMQVRVEV